MYLREVSGFSICRLLYENQSQGLNAHHQVSSTEMMPDSGCTTRGKKQSFIFSEETNNLGCSELEHQKGASVTEGRLLNSHSKLCLKSKLPTI